MTDPGNFWLPPASVPSAEALADGWTQVFQSGVDFLRASADRVTAPSAPLPFDPVAPTRAMMDFYRQVLANPAALAPVQSKGVENAVRLAGNYVQRATGSHDVEPVISPARGDRRFNAPEWSAPPFDFLKQAYLLTADHVMELIAATEGLEPAVRTRVEFYAQQFLHAISPANFAHTNPEALRKAVDTGSISLLSGLANMLADAASPDGMVRRRAADAFELGVNIAATRGSVVFENELMQLIQYAPATDTVYRRPLLYVPPLVNKYYFLDLKPEASLLRWLVEQGHTVFTISWVNPGDDLSETSMEDYILLGPLAALDAIEAATGEREISAFAFCMGGTLLAMAMAYLAAKGEQDRIVSATTIGTLLDFGDLDTWATFLEPSQMDALDRHLTAKGVLSAQSLQALFAVVRSNDLVWSSVVNHYLLDREAPSSDILYWFADGSQMTGAFLKQYVRDLLAGNKLVEADGMAIDGESLDLGKITAPLFAVSLKDDHVSGWAATYTGVQAWGGPKTFLLGGSGHNAGVINPPAANKHGHWVNKSLPATGEAWLEGATKKDGSWWPEWQAWLTADREDDRVPQRVPGDGKLRALEPAPGSYVRFRH